MGDDTFVETGEVRICLIIAISEIRMPRSGKKDKHTVVANTEWFYVNPPDIHT